METAGSRKSLLPSNDDLVLRVGVEPTWDNFHIVLLAGSLRTYYHSLSVTNYSPPASLAGASIRSAIANIILHLPFYYPTPCWCKPAYTILYYSLVQRQ